MQTEPKQVRDFFNEISPSYRNKYTKIDVFHHYFFNERLIEATRGFDFEKSQILDIGAGTGNLYDHLLKIDPSIDYYATDIAEAMLRESKIPESRRFVGKIEEIELPIDLFDYVFLLGVTTYLDDPELQATIHTIGSKLKTNGRAIITFTNKNSLDWKSRKMVKALFGKLMNRNLVLGQTFTTYARELKSISNLVSKEFIVEDVRLLNHTIFPLNQFLKGISVTVAKKIHALDSSGTVARWLSSDFLMILRRV